MRRVCLAVALAVTAVAAPAGEFNKVLSVGDAGPDWKDLDGTDGQKHALADLKTARAVVVVFTCNDCPIAGAYEDRLIAFAKKHEAAGVRVVAINPNPGKKESLTAMTARATKKKYPFPYLADPTQAVTKAYGAQYTPEFVVLDANRKVAYLGAMDDKDNEADAKESFLEPAVAAALAGKPAAKKETLARGCRVIWKRD